MIFSFLINTSGLFDFDFTFLFQAFLFFILALAITFFFLIPISKTLEERSQYINFNLFKSLIIIEFTSEQLIKSINLFLKESRELEREFSIFNTELTEIFQEEFFLMKLETNKLIKMIRGRQLSQIAKNFHLLIPEIEILSVSFFKNYSQTISK